MNAIKDFFSFQSIKDNKIFFILFLIMGVLVPFTPFKMFFIFNPIALIMAFMVWIISSRLDKKFYFNIGSFIVTMIFGYFVFTVVFKILTLN